MNITDLSHVDHLPAPKIARIIPVKVSRAGF
jgi:hypothetical protein